MGPLCNLYGNALAAAQQQAVLAPKDVLQIVQQSIVLLGQASEHISQQRRRHLLKRHEPSSLPVLQDALNVTDNKLRTKQDNILFGAELFQK